MKLDEGRWKLGIDQLFAPETFKKKDRVSNYEQDFE